MTQLPWLLLGSYPLKYNGLCETTQSPSTSELVNIFSAVIQALAPYFTRKSDTG